MSSNLTLKSKRLVLLLVLRNAVVWKRHNHEKADDVALALVCQL